jgi:drug/metabolite transporter (DMT)-like permease
MNHWALDKSFDPIAFSGVRFTFAAFAFLPLAIRGSGPLPKSFKGKTPGKLLWFWGGLAAGFPLIIYSILQYMGLEQTSSGKAGFISGMYVIIVPLIAMFTGRFPGIPFWIGLALAVCGLWLLSNPGGEGSLNRGDALMLLSATFTAVHVLVTSRFSNRVDPVRFVTVQLFLTGIVSLAIAVFRGNMPPSSLFWQTLPVSLFGIISLAGGILGQTAAQRHMRSSEVALMLQLQGVFAALFAMIFMDEVMTMLMWFGAFLVMAGAAMAQSRSKRGAGSPAGKPSAGQQAPAGS